MEKGLFLTVMNTTETEQKAIISLDSESLKLENAITCVDLLLLESQEVNGHRFEVNVKEKDVKVFKVMQ